MAKMPVEFARSRFQIKLYDDSVIPSQAKASESKKGKALREIERRNEIRDLEKQFEL